MRAFRDMKSRQSALLLNWGLRLNTYGVMR
jgi:hypothetical protein